MGLPFFVPTPRLRVGAIDGVAGDDESNENQASKEHHSRYPVRLTPTSGSLPGKSREANRHQGTGNADGRDQETEESHERGHNRGSSWDIEVAPVHFRNVAGCDGASRGAQVLEREPRAGTGAPGPDCSEAAKATFLALAVRRGLTA